VDFISDEALQRALQSMPLSTTMIVIAHRAASLTWMDRILVMDDGKIAEDDSPLALLQKTYKEKHDGGTRESYYREAVKLEGGKALQQAIQSAKFSAMSRHRRKEHM
jgi:ABC-type protease/lipase transport system fused ATPase/permease subunit